MISMTKNHSSFMRTIRILGAASLAALFMGTAGAPVSIAAPLSSSTDESTPPIVGATWAPHQDTYNSTCAGGTVPVGMEAAGGSYVTSASLLCRDAAGNVTAADSGNAGSGTAVELLCPAGTFLAGMHGRTGDVVDALGIRCGTGDPASNTSGAITSGTGGDPVGPIDCEGMMTSLTTWAASSWYGYTLTGAQHGCSPVPVTLVAHKATVVSVSSLKSGVTFSATASSPATGGPAAALPVTFTATTLLGTSYFCTATTTSAGLAACKVTLLNSALSLLPGTYTASTPGTAAYGPASAKGTIALL
jgi:hypothetical protein